MPTFLCTRSEAGPRRSRGQLRQGPGAPWTARPVCPGWWRSPGHLMWRGTSRWGAWVTCHRCNALNCLFRKSSKRFKSFQEKLNRMKKTRKCPQSGNMQQWYYYLWFSPLTSLFRWWTDSAWCFSFCSRQSYLWSSLFQLIQMLLYLEPFIALHVISCCLV